jgi:hypothetical protein
MPRVITGSGTTKGRPWQPYAGGGGPGIYIDVDAADANFPYTPVYVCSLHGNTRHWATTGGSSVYNASASGFRVYVRQADGSSLSPSDAATWGWHIAWFGQWFSIPFPEGPDPER